MPQQAIDFAGPDGTIDATLHTPEGEGPWPGVLLLTDILGPRPTYYQMADRLAAAGYAVLLPNVFYRNGRAPVPDFSMPFGQPETMQALFKLASTLTPERMRADGKAEVDYLLSRPEVKKGPVGAVGYCMSGKFAIYTALAAGDRVAAAAAFHGSGLIDDSDDSPHKAAARVKAELYFGHAENDDFLPSARVPELEKALQDAGSTFKSEVYAARHGFAVPGGPSFDEAAAERHWRSMLDLFDRNLK